MLTRPLTPNPLQRGLERPPKQGRSQGRSELKVSRRSRAFEVVGRMASYLVFRKTAGTCEEIASDSVAINKASC